MSRYIHYLRHDVEQNCLKFIDLMAMEGFPVLVTETTRTDAEQYQHYLKGASQAKTPSFHAEHAGLAFDVCKNVKGQEYSDERFWEAAGRIGKAMGFTWGGDWAFVDKPHFQWDNRGKFTGTMIRNKQYPPTMPLFTGVIPPPAEAPKPTLRKGSKGSDVYILQDRLNSLGFNCGTVDGDFGPKTDAAVRAFQKAAGIGVDGIVGPQTWAALESWSAKPSVPMIVSKDILPISQPGTGLNKIPNSTSGSFYGAFKDVAGKIYYAPVSICVAKGKTYRSVSCHYFEGYPESVIYRTQTGQLGIKRVSSTSELPALSWAVGGMGLLDFYDPPAEGFKKIGNLDFSDVLRKTNHVMLGVKGEKIYQVFCANMTAQEVNSKAREMGLEMAIMLDGGHIAGINGDVKINTEITQYYVIQGK